MFFKRLFRSQDAIYVNTATIFKDVVDRNLDDGESYENVIEALSIYIMESERKNKGNVEHYLYHITNLENRIADLEKKILEQDRSK